MQGLNCARAIRYRFIIPHLHASSTQILQNLQSFYSFDRIKRIISALDACGAEKVPAPGKFSAVCTLLEENKNGMEITHAVLLIY